MSQVEPDSNSYVGMDGTRSSLSAIDTNRSLEHRGQQQHMAVTVDHLCLLVNLALGK